MAGVLDGKTALVTGASRGIGRAIAARLAQDGATVAVHYGRSRAEAESLVGEIESAGGRAFPLPADLAGPSSEIRRLFERLDIELGGAPLDILVNNAGIADRAEFADTDEATYDRLFQVNVKALFFITQQALRRLADGGRVINISSVVARTHFAGIPAYSATKAAVNTLTTHLAVELGERAITVNAIAPGLIDTDMNAAWFRSDEGRAVAHGIQALKRVGQPDDIASAVAFLAGPDGGWVTGQVIETTGGTKL